jgi:hypothetical protein
MATYHQSQIKAWAECPAQVGYELAGLPTTQNSYMAYGTAQHAAMEVLERKAAEARASAKRNSEAYEKAYAAAIQAAVDYFLWVWSPLNIETICEPVPEDGWAPGHGYSELRTKGVDAIRKWAEIRRYSAMEVLATEYAFNVPIPGTWDAELEEPHRLAGAIDLLGANAISRIPYVEIGDFKTGKIPVALRHEQQFTAYAMASTQREFWIGDRGEDGFGVERGEELFQRFHGKARRGTWISLKTFKYIDAGWRGPIDYKRFAIAVQQVHASIAADIFPLSISGERCRYCPFRKVCAGTGIATEKHGDPRVDAA